MSLELAFAAEPFTGETEFDEWERPDPRSSEEFELSFEWAGEVSRNSKEYVRWLQQSLNQVLNLRLAVDGDSGAQTRSAVRSFQQRQGLKADGVVGRQTEAALVAAGAAPPPGGVTASAGENLRVAAAGGAGTQPRGASKKLPPAACACAAFFAEYDLNFEPQSPTRGVPANRRLTASDKRLRQADVRAMVAELLSRRDARAREALLGRVPVWTAPSSGSLIPIAQRLSTAQLELYRKCFPDGAGGINWGTFSPCFEKFANGDLRTWNNPRLSGVGEPNGGFFFLFAEFAFLCIDLGIDVDDWTEALRIFVRAQELFMHAYRAAPQVYRPGLPRTTPYPLPPPVNAPPPSPSRCTAFLSFDRHYEDKNFNPRGQSSDARKVALRAKYSSMDFAALQNAARDNMLRALCIP